MSPLFVNRSGEAFTIDSFGKVFQRLRDESGIKNFSAHVLRHTWATDFMREPGNDLLDLKRQGGWAKFEMVERYSHATPPRDRTSLPNPLARLSGNNPRPFKRLSRPSLRIA